MPKKPNASNITHGLAQLGGGSKKDGGGGMMAGMQNIFKKGIEIGNRLGLEGKDVMDTALLDNATGNLIGQKEDKE